MRRFLTVVIVVPLLVLFVVFAVANRHFVTVSFDPFNAVDPALSVSIPLFALIIAVAILGVIAGGCATGSIGDGGVPPAGTWPMPKRHGPKSRS